MNINFATKDGKMVLTVADEAGEVHASTHDSLKAAQKAANKGLKDGWDTLAAGLKKK